MAKLSTILDQIDAGSMLLPEFQRGYVWNRDQVRGLMRSLYLGYPVGALLVWETEGGSQAVRGGQSSSGQKQLLLDGQQRVTTLYGIMRGAAPTFFEGDPAAFTGLRFNVETEVFEFHAPVKMKDDPLWIDVTGLFRDDIGVQYQQLNVPELSSRFGVYVDRLARLRGVKDRDFHIEQITGADKTVDVVVDIFNRVNSGGTKLSKGDLALARICSEWGDARPTMRRNLDRWAQRDLRFTPDWLLRNVNAIATGRAPFSALEDVSASDFEDALYKCLHNVDHLLDLVGARLGLDHDRVLMGRYALPVLSRLMHSSGGRFADNAETDKALFWYVHAALRGRFAGSTETFLAKDLETIDSGGIDGVIASLARSRKGNMTIDAQDFEGVGRGSRSYPLLYMITRVREGLDLVSGRALGQDSSSIDVHEIFPKAQLAKHGYSRSEVNAIANFAFVSPSSAATLSRSNPGDYLSGCSDEVLASQWIPADRRLWEIENYREFLTARRELLAAATATFLSDLQAGRHPWDREITPVTVIDGGGEDKARNAQLDALLGEFADLGLAAPERDTGIDDPVSGRELAIAELFWPDGLQAGQGMPVVLELDPDDADLDRLAELGYEVFTTVDALRGNVMRRSAVVAGDETDGGTAVSPDQDIDDEPVEADGGAFEQVVLDGIETSRVELSYFPRFTLEMVHRLGGVGTARRLLATPTVSDGFVRLWEADRLDLTLEAAVVQDRFAALFTDEERGIARTRLEKATRPMTKTFRPTDGSVHEQRDRLARDLAQHRRVVRAAAERNEFVDLPRAEYLHDKLGRALERWDSYDGGQRATLAEAVGYLIRLDDEEDDLRSPVGFDDDAEVVEAALRLLSPSTG